MPDLSASPEVDKAGSNGVGKAALLQSVQRAGAVLEVVAQRPGLSAQQIAEVAGLERTGAHRLLRTLEQEQLVERVGRGYLLGARNLLLGNSYLSQHSLRQVSLPYLIDLLYRVFADQPWSLAVLTRVGNRVTLVSHLWSPLAPLDSLLAIGLSGRVERAAGGRSMLAFLPPTEVADIVGAEIAGELAPRLEQIRSDGGLEYVGSNQKTGAPEGLSAMSACIRNAAGVPVAALTLSGAALEEELYPTSTPAQHLLRAAAQIGNALV